MKRSRIKKIIIIDPVTQAEKWKDAIDREIKGISEIELTKIYDKTVKIIAQKYRIDRVG